MKKFVSAALALFLVCCASALLASCSEKPTVTTPPTKIAARLAEVDARDAAEELGRPKDGGFTLAENGVSEYAVVVPDGASEYLRRHATYFADVLRKMTGADFPVIDVSEAGARNKTIVFNRDPEAEIPDRKDDGYAVKCVRSGEKETIYVCGADEYASVNGVYGFLEDELRCMFAREDFDFVPAAPTVILPPLDKTVNPSFSWRKIYQIETTDEEWYTRLRLNGTETGDSIENYAGWGTWCHSFFAFVPPSVYFDSHPEYFSLIDGERRIAHNGTDGQLCLSNPEVLNLIEERLAELILKDEERARETGKKPALYWDVSAMDGWARCRCGACEKAFTECGNTTMGQLIPLLNRLAKRFPDKIVSTLAYQNSLNAPKKIVGADGGLTVPEGGIRLEDNVAIKMCTMVGSQLHSYRNGTNGASAESKRLIESWSAVTNKIVVWDYVVNFSNLLMPYPNFAAQKENVEFYAENHITAVFHQGSRERGGEAARLRSYVLSKQLWDLDTDVDLLIARYLRAAYGAGADALAEYLDLMSAAVAEGADLNLYDEPKAHKNGYLSVPAIEKYFALLGEAKAAIEADGGSKDELYRLEEFEINVLYAKMYDDSFDFGGKADAAERFGTLAEKHGVSMVSEWSEPGIGAFLAKDYRLALEKRKGLLAAIFSAAAIAAVALCFAVFALVLWNNRKHEK